MPQSRTGASTARSGASAATAVSNRTWSLPLPVQPWATAPASYSRAIDTMYWAISGRESAETSGYRPSYKAPACSTGSTMSRANSSRASTITTSLAPA